MKTSKTIDPWAKLDALNSAAQEPTGKEWFSTPEYAKRYSVSIRNAGLRLKKLTMNGVLEEWRGVGISSDGKRRMLNKYRFAK